MKTNLTKKQMEIVAKFEPKTAKGTDIGSFFGNKKACAYAFCGGKENYGDGKLYKLGQKAYMEAYDNDETWERLNGVKVAKTSRGSSKKSTSKKAPTNKSLEDRVSSLEEKLDLILAKLG